MDLAHVYVVVEAVRVSGLVVAGRASGSTFSEDSLYPVEVPVEPIDPLASYPEPCPAVDPRSPLSEVGRRRFSTEEGESGR